ncbi:probable sucrose-phosphate synthase 2 isoform X1 [Abrus precatorius]|uniref:Sucrose-phosphate synthase n=1 Tax=Abrus precatorius TaxID=3816 RepID=A0A8B8JLP0_ABRPR|nr:probable sucrose-phosphate synthase 2 isoform X1 [Abrus precatorius]
MAGNEWINGYLEAILSTGAATVDEQKKVAPRESGHFNPTKYFVEEVVTSVDESDLHRTWIKVVATRNTRERSSRLENMCWRIWHLARKKKQLEGEELQRLANRRWEREQGRRDVTEDMSEELSEGEKGDGIGEMIQIDETAKKNFLRQISNLEVWSDDKKEKKLYIVLLSLHGLVRGENMELGRDSDTGGQIKYVVELARALANMPGVYRVDLFTRQISSQEIDWSYGEPTEMLTAEPDDDDNIGESSGAYIIRIPFGPRDKYLPKELLWPYVQEFVDGALAHILNMSKVLGEQVGGGQPVWPYVIHGHYADAGDSAALLSGALNVPMVLTGHSLGRNKLEQLLKQGRQSKEDINSTYKIMRRIEAEELSLDAAELVITSTKQEIEEQWGLYDGFDVKLEKVLRARVRRGVNCHGRYMPRMAVIPPGMDFSNVVVQEDGPEVDGELSQITNGADGSSPKDLPPIWSEVMRFFTNPHKPMILALSRPDPKKNITTLLKAFGECPPLRKLANLTLIMGNRDDIDEMSTGNASVLTTVLKLIDKYDLYGQVAYPKHHRQSDVPEIYRFAAKTKGVFINPALVEPFGLTLIEAAAHGLPMVATKNGGPVDIHRALNNGLLVDPHDQQAIANALLKLLSEKNLWHECRKNGWKNIHLFSWPEHCRTYLTRVAACRMRHPQWQTNTPEDDNVVEESLNDSLKDVQDMSLRLSIDGDLAAASGGLEIQDQVKRVLSKIKKSDSSPNQDGVNKIRKQDSGSNDGGENVLHDNVTSKYPLLRRRRRLIVIAIDLYDNNGIPEKKMIEILQRVIKSVQLEPHTARVTGFALSTAMPMLETVEFLTSGNVPVNEFDALICSSGSEVYYPGINAEEGKLLPDPDYEVHIDYRWGCEGLKKTIWKLMNGSEGDEISKKVSSPIEEDVKSSNAHCISYKIKDLSKAKKVDDLRQKLRMRGLRCHPMYCRRLSRMHVIPLLASRAQALRYLFVRWRLNVTNMYVILGEAGDTDYEEMISGTHKTIIMKGVVSKGSEELFRGPGSYQRDDIVPNESPLVAYISDITEEKIANTMKQLSKCGGI